MTAQLLDKMSLTEGLKNEKFITFSFCEPFMENLSGYLRRHYIEDNRDLSRLAIVFGGKRPALFLKRELSKDMKTSFYPPKIFSVDEWITYILRKDKEFVHPGDLDNCYLLYKLAKNLTPDVIKGREKFSQFLPWTREILGLIDQLDLENVDDQSLMKIQANARIGYAVPEDINELLKNVVVLRSAYHQKMNQQKTFSRGYQYLQALQAMDQNDFDEFDQILFCNFFYFNRCEEAIAKNLYERKKATFIFQGDQSRWPVMHRIARNFSCDLIEEPLKNPEFVLKLYSTMDVQSQVCQVREILKNIEDVDKTVIVLPQSDNLIPLLCEITKTVKDLNVSMGYPLKRSSLYCLYDALFKAQLSKKEDRYYSKDYLKVLRHPFIKNLKYSSNMSITRVLIHKIEEILTGQTKTSVSGSSFIRLNDIEELDDLYLLASEMLERMHIESSRRELKSIIKNIHKLVFLNWEDMANFDDFSENLDKSLKVLTEKSIMGNYPLNFNIANKMLDIKDEFINATFAKEKFPKEELFRIFDAKVSREMIAFVGSPLKGLQVLGLLETRSLNFQNVIVMDVNEAVLPKLSIYEPLIPREVMINLNLDRLELEEEIQRYQFMRLISSAKNVHLLYQENKEKEKSRFIEELIWEKQKEGDDTKTVKISRPTFEVNVATNKIVVEKTPKMIEYLKKRTYSSSSINTYLRDPLEFYYNYVLCLKEKEELLDEPEARHVGTFIHELLEEGFKPFIKKKPKIDSAFRNWFGRIFERKFDDEFGRTMKSDAFLLKSVLRERLLRFLDREADNQDVKEILHLERRFEDSMTLSSGDFKFSYIIDRIDRLNDGTILIIDYKTGSIHQMPKSLELIETMELTRESIFENVRSFQIPLYFHYLMNQFPGEKINAALYNLRTLEMTKFIDQKRNHAPERINEVFSRALDFVIREILDPTIPFGG